MAELEIAPGTGRWARGLLVVLAAELDVLRFGFPDAPIPYDYPFSA